MSKYDSLKSFLKGQRSDLVPMTFHEVEAVVGLKLPNSKRYPAWWSNNPSNNVMTKIWLEAGFMTEQVDIGGERLVFRRTRESSLNASSSRPTSRAPSAGGLVAGLRKALGGTVRFAPGYDPATPTDEVWDAERG